MLRQFYQATGGPQWTDHSNWLTGTSLAEAAAWRGIEVQNGDVTTLDQYNNHLAGSLPASLGRLTGLRVLNVAANTLTGPVPASYGQLVQLQRLSLQGNQLSGALPASLGQLTELQGFNADYNQFTGSLPASFGRWHQVNAITLNDNQLSGPLPASWGRLQALSFLTLHNNRLSGPLPDSLGNCSNLSYVWLSNNQFTGPFPASWGRLSHLGYLELSANRLTGPLPAELTNLTALGTLNLSGNQLTGPLPDHWERMVALAGLGLNNNQLEGPLPTSFGQLPALSYCSLDHNQFSGPLPAPAGGGWRHLIWLQASVNQLSGPLPDSLGTCHALRVLDLSDNQLSGPLPATLGGLRSLEQLMAPRNALTGPLPAALGQLRQLWFVNLTFNRLTGTLPGAWGRLTGLRQLYLSQNQLQGPLPDSLGQLRELGYLALDQNQLTGPLPAAWKGMRGLQALYLRDNQLSGTLPDSLAAVELYLDRNQFGGELPASYGTSPTLRILSLNGNEFTQLPYFLALPNIAQFQPSITDNWLAFDSYERNQPVAGDGSRWYYWNYGYTQRQPPASTQQVVTGAAATLDGHIGGNSNHYQWQRWVGGQWVPMPGQTQPTLGWAAVTGADAGTYRTQVSSDWVTNITLYSPSLVLDIVPYQPLAQNRPDDTNQNPTHATAPPALAVARASRQAPAAGQEMNFVRVWSPRIALTDSTRVARAPVDSVSMSTQYVDGLGRPVQTVLKQASPGRRDLVQAQAYDGLGREPYAFLPYPATDSAGARPAGAYRPQALWEQYRFYARPGLPGGGYGPPAPQDATTGVARTAAAYAETQFEASPLNRVTAQGAPGEAWQLTAGHVVEREERPNTAADSVLRFTPGYDPRSVDPGYQGFYPDGELWGTQVADVHGPTEVGRWATAPSNGRIS